MLLSKCISEYPLTSRATFPCSSIPKSFHQPFAMLLQLAIQIFSLRPPVECLNVFTVHSFSFCSDYFSLSSEIFWEKQRVSLQGFDQLVWCLILKYLFDYFVSLFYFNTTDSLWLEKIWFFHPPTYGRYFLQLSLCRFQKILWIILKTF